MTNILLISARSGAAGFTPQLLARRAGFPRVGAASLSIALLAWVAALAAVAQAAEQPRARVLLIVDSSVYPEIKSGLETYAEHIRREFNIACLPRPGTYYGMQPPQIRAILKQEYEAKDVPPLVGAIFVGPIPHACRTHDPREILIPSPLYYEDFDAEWIDADNDGYFESIKTDRRTNATEIWTAWWIPPANDGPTQVALLKSWLKKLDRYHRGEITGRDQMLWLAGNVQDVEICEGWTVLLKDTMQPLDQKLRIWCRVGQDEGTFRPNKRKDEFTPKDFVTAFTLQPWQHIHVVAHGNARGWYWDGCGVVIAPPPDGKPEAVVLLDLSTLQGGAANIVTTSGCSNGNFRGDYIGPAYDRSMGNRLLFSDNTITVAYYGAASPQSTSSFAGYCTEIIESLKADGGSYLGEGYFKMRNHDYSWGTQHYFFRGGDEKVLSGDPFARYRDRGPFSDEQRTTIDKRIEAAGWTVVGPG